MDGVKKNLRDSVMSDIAAQCRKNRKNNPDNNRVNIFFIWINYDMSYDDFINIILSLDDQEYLTYKKADKDAKKYHVRGENVPQEIVFVSGKGRSFLEDLSDEKKEEFNSSLKRPLLQKILIWLASTILSYESIMRIWSKIKLILSYLHS